MYNKKLISFLIPSLEGGGAERVVINLIREFSKKEDLNVELLVLKKRGNFFKYVPENCKIYNLNTKKALFSLSKIIKYIKTNKPYVIISNITHMNIISMVSKIFSKTKTKFILIEHLNINYTFKEQNYFYRFLFPILVYLTYRFADLIIAVSIGVKDSIISKYRFLEKKVKVIYNPIDVEEILNKKCEKIDHPWFNQNKIPIIISAGRLNPQKDFQTLLKAFSIVREKRKVFLVILGDGEERENLIKLAKNLGIYEYLWMPGFVDNPYKYISKSNLFILSSKSEGFANVIVEALACGTRVISTDCESGPREILKDGKYGKLVNVGDYKKLAEEILIELDNNVYDKNILIERAKDFDSKKIANEYLNVLNS